MPEGGPHAPILIATSWQALGRVLQGDQETKLCNCTIVILFAGFYIEANLNYIVKYIGMTNKMESFLKRNHPGVQDKLAWFYNEFVARTKSPNRIALYRQDITKKIRKRFPGFAKLYKFRNDISHGVINRSAKSLQETQKLRNQATKMVAEIFKIMKKNGYDIPRNTNYYEAINS